ncbi:MAG TPA: branched-chain amino acid ABC transporter permease [Methylomirabilota bacterium]|jgi:branched-chain amino acid transport system permease protein
MLKRLASHGRVVLTLAVFAALGAATPFLNDYLQSIITRALVFAIMAMSLDVLVGYTGLRSMGHGVYFALGAYSAAIMIGKMNVANLLGVFGVGLGLSCAAALFLGLLAIRAVGVYFMMITLSFSMVMWGLVYRWHTVTGGDNGITGIIPPDAFGLSLQDPVLFFYFTFAIFMVCLGLLFLLVKSPFGKTLVGIRESEARMKMLGYNTWLHKYLAFVISGTFAGISGTLWAMLNRFIAPTDVELVTSVEALLMVALGGPATLVGPVIGAGVIMFLRYWVSTYIERWYMFLGITYIITILYARGGIIGLVERLWSRKEEAPSSAPDRRVATSLTTLEGRKQP